MNMYCLQEQHFWLCPLCFSGQRQCSPKDTMTIIWNSVWGIPVPETIETPSIILSVRLPRVICVALTGASLSLCGGAMQGLLRNPLADGSTLGVSSGAALGAVIAIAFGITMPSLPFAGTMIMAIVFYLFRLS